MLHEFLDIHRTELIERCRVKVMRRSAPRPTIVEMEHGIPLFLSQLGEALRNEMLLQVHANPRAANEEPLHRDARQEISATAKKHGSEMLRQGFTVNQVVHDYGDLCQAITEIAGEKGVVVPVAEFQTLNRCLDNAIADAVTAFTHKREQNIAEGDQQATSERLGFLAHELRNFLNTAMLSFAAIKSGSVAVNGATSEVLDRSLTGLRDLIDRALADVRLAAGVPTTEMVGIAVDRFITEAQVSASLEARRHDCAFTVYPVAKGLSVHGDRQMLASAVSNLLQNAFKFTRPQSHVSLKAYGNGDRVMIEVEDQCGGLPEGKEESLFHSFEQHHEDRSGLGLGLSIARRSVEVNHGSLRVRDMPGLGCVFTIDLPRSLPPA